MISLTNLSVIGFGELRQVMIMTILMVISFCLPVHNCLGFSELLDKSENPGSLSIDQSTMIRDLSGKEIPWGEHTKVRVYAFLGCECPVAQLYARRLQDLSTDKNFADVSWVGVMSNLHDSSKDILKFNTQVNWTMPMVHDNDQSLARALQVTRTAEVVVVNRSGSVLYRGRIDDQYAPGVKKSKVTKSELRDALVAILSDRQPAVARTEPVGCLISWGKTKALDIQSSSLNYSDQISKILFQRCYECHRPGEIGPFDVSDPAEIQGWAEMILEVVDNGRMPPWHADPAHGSFKNARSIPKNEIEMLRQWVRAGAPLGDLSQVQKPQPTNSATDSAWRFDREPDLVVPMRNKAYEIPADGTVEYQYFVVDPMIKEDKWVSAAQIIPGTAAVVHHAIVFIRPPDDQEFSGLGWLTAYVPGQMATKFPEGYARRIPAGSKLVFQMHYTPNGKATTDLSQLGMTFIEPNKVTNEVFTLVGIDQDFEIPPGASNYEVNGKVPYLPPGAELLAVSPHMHLRGRTFELRAKRAEDTTILLKVPNYDFNWQHTYEFSERIPLSDLEGLEFTVGFDNSENNPANPAPNEYVMWGDQTWEEMAVAFFEVARPRTESQGTSIANRAERRSNLSSSQEKSQTSVSPDMTAKAEQFADDYLKKLDINRDGWVAWEETPRVVQDYSFSRLDHDGDKRITREELIEAMVQRRGK